MELMFLEFHPPGERPVAAGFFLLETERDELHFRVRKEWPEILDPVDRLYLESVDQTFRMIQRDKGSVGLIDFLESTLSNVLRLSGRLKLHNAVLTPEQLANHLTEALLSPPAAVPIEKAF